MQSIPPLARLVPRAMALDGDAFRYIKDNPKAAAAGGRLLFLLGIALGLVDVGRAIVAWATRPELASVQRLLARELPSLPLLARLDSAWMARLVGPGSWLWPVLRWLWPTPLVSLLRLLVVTLAILGLLDSPTEGTYILNGKPVQGLKLSERARIRNREIGFIFQAFNLIGDLTVYENVELPLTYRGMGGAERKKRVHGALERVGMAHRVKHYPSQLSGGQQQRVAVARALAGDPSILLADEPTGNLDSANGEAVMELLRELHRNGATICMVTHDPRYAEYAGRAVHLFDGRIAEVREHAAR